MTAAGLARPLEVLRALAVAHFRESRQISIVGIIRWVLEPLIYMGVYFVVVAAVLGRARDAYPLFLLCALIPFRYFSSVVNESMLLFRRYADVIQNRAFPLEVLPVVLAAVEAIPFAIAMFLLSPLMAYYQVPIGIHLLWVPLVLGVLLVLIVGPVFLGAMFGHYFPDFRGVAQNMIRILFFVSSGLVPLSEVPGDQLPDLLRANPLSGIFDSFRALLLYGRSPRLFDLAYPFLVGCVLIAVSLWAFRKRRYEVPKEVY